MTIINMLLSKNEKNQGWGRKFPYNVQHTDSLTDWSDFKEFTTTQSRDNFFLSVNWMKKCKENSCHVYTQCFPAVVELFLIHLTLECAL